MYSVLASRFGRGRSGAIALAAFFIFGPAPAGAAERGFPFNSELFLDAKPMRGSKRVPMLIIGARGETMIEAWCNTVKAQIVVTNDMVAILTGPQTDQQCVAERVRADEILLAALLAVTHWRREADMLTLLGPKTLRFRTLTH